MSHSKALFTTILHSFILFLIGSNAMAHSKVSISDSMGVSQRSTSVSPRMVIEVFKRPQNLGVKKEFLTITIDGHLERISVISSPLENRSTVEGTFTLKPVFAIDKDGESAPDPWLKSKLPPYRASMYWGLQIKDIYMLHSTPHYSKLGHPASAGCIRTNYPTAMEIFDNVVNRFDGVAEIRIYRSGSVEAKKAFEEKNLDVSWVNDQIQLDLEDAYSVSTTDYYGYGHARRGQALVFPECGNNRDCFSIWNRKKP